jgi:hypothetical protein
MAAVVCRTGTKAQTEFSTEKFHIKKIFQHIIGTGRSRGAFCYLFIGEFSIAKIDHKQPIPRL